MKSSPLSLALLAVVFLFSGNFAAAQKKPAATPPGVTAHRDIPYVANGDKRQQLDLYLPKNAKPGAPLPLIIWIHGGGWNAGSKASCYPLNQGFAARGYALASIGYRLTTTARFPAQIEDCKAAVRWLRAHAAEYNIDPARFAVWGSSAGGHLAALLGTTGSIQKFDTKENAAASGRVQAVVDFYGPSDLTAPEMWNPSFETRTQLIGGTLAEKPEMAALASPVKFVAADAPPFFIWHGTKDARVPLLQARRLHDALKKAGVHTELRIVEGAGHGTKDFTKPAYMEEIAKFLEARLRPAPRD